MACFAAIGHGADPWSTRFIDETSWRARTSGSSAAMRTNCVGTMFMYVTRSASTSARSASASKRSINTTVCPHASACNG
jgi:hypothetical protein